MAAVAIIRFGLMMLTGLGVVSRVGGDVVIWKITDGRAVFSMGEMR
jgi:hypothetical protein